MMRIPKMLWCYWGRTPMSQLQALTIESFRRHNPTWEITLIRPKDECSGPIIWDSPEQSVPYTGHDFSSLTSFTRCMIFDFEEAGFDVKSHDVKKADFVRWHVLHKYGGVWSDLDIYYLRPIPDDWLDCACGCGSFVVRTGRTIQLGFVGSSGGQYARELMASLTRRDLVLEATRILPYRWSVYPYLPSETARLFAPPPWSEVELARAAIVCHESVGVHWYNGSPHAKQAINSGNLGLMGTIIGQSAEIIRW